MDYRTATPVPKPPKRKRKRRQGFDRPPGEFCQYCGIVPRGGVRIERHHITLRGMGGSRSAEIHSEDNRIDLCAGPGSSGCHMKAHLGAEGYRPADLRAKKAEAETWAERLGRMLAGPARFL